MLTYYKIFVPLVQLKTTNYDQTSTQDKWKSIV